MTHVVLSDSSIAIKINRAGVEHLLFPSHSKPFSVLILGQPCFESLPY